MNAKRGYVPEDDRNFSPEALEILRTAAKHITYLINEGYDLKQASVFVGNHFLLSERQRLALVRSLAPRSLVEERLSKRKSLPDLAGQTVWIDGFNEIITLEVLFSHSLLFRCADSAIRDLAALRGTYRLIPETDQAVEQMLRVLRDHGVSSAVILLDEPVSNSGRLKTRIAEIAETMRVPVDIRILRDVDRTLYDRDFVISSDSVVLDHCRSWVNLTEVCAEENHAEVINLLPCP